MYGVKDLRENVELWGGNEREELGCVAARGGREG